MDLFLLQSYIQTYLHKSTSLSEMRVASRKWEDCNVASPISECIEKFNTILLYLSSKVEIFGSIAERYNFHVKKYGDGLRTDR